MRTTCKRIIIIGYLSHQANKVKITLMTRVINRFIRDLEFSKNLDIVISTAGTETTGEEGVSLLWNSWLIFTWAYVWN